MSIKAVGIDMHAADLLPQHYDLICYHTMNSQQPGPTFSLV